MHNERGRGLKPPTLPLYLHFMEAQTEKAEKSMALFSSAL